MNKIKPYEDTKMDISVCVGDSVCRHWLDLFALCGLRITINSY